LHFARLVFLASNEGKSQLWVRPLDSLAVQPLAGTDGATYPFWSPDSASVGFFADKLKRIDIVGGAPQVLANAAAGRGGAWNRGGTVLFAPNPSGPVLKIPATGASQWPSHDWKPDRGATDFRSFYPMAGISFTLSKVAPARAYTPLRSMELRPSGSPIRDRSWNGAVGSGVRKTHSSLHRSKVAVDALKGTSQELSDPVLGLDVGQTHSMAVRRVQ